MGCARGGSEGGWRRRCDHRGPLSLAALLAATWAGMASGHPRDGGCPSTVTYGGYAGQRTVEVESGIGPADQFGNRRANVLTLEATPVQADGVTRGLTYVSDESRPNGDIMLGGGRHVQGVAAAVLTWEEGTTYGISSAVVADPALLCLYELESNRYNTGSIRGATGDLGRGAQSALLYPYLQWTPSPGYHAMHQLVVLVFAIRPEVPGYDGELSAGENGLIVHSLWRPLRAAVPDGQLAPSHTPPTRHGCACLPNTIDEDGNLVPACETRGQWCDVVPGSCGTAQPYSGKVGGNYAGWDYCEPLPAGQVATAHCRYDNDGVCDAGTPLCPENSDFDDCHCAYEADGVCDEGETFGDRSVCPYGSDSSDCCPTTDDGVCDEGRRCPVLSDRFDCFCATKWNSHCEEVGPAEYSGLVPAGTAAAAQCAFMSDQGDCAYEAQDEAQRGRPVCPSQYEHNGECDAGGMCPCGTDVDDCSEEPSPLCSHQSCSIDPTDPNCLHDSCATSSNCHGEEPQYCAWWSDYSYTAYCRPCVQHGRTCSDFGDAVEGSCDVCEAVAQECAETEMQVRLTLKAPSGNGWDGRWYQLQAFDDHALEDNFIGHSGSPVSTRDKSVYTFVRSFCIKVSECYRLDASLLTPYKPSDFSFSTTQAPPVHGSQLTWQADLFVGEDVIPSGFLSTSGGYGSFMIPVAVPYSGTGPTATHPQVTQATCDALLCGPGRVHITVEISPSSVRTPYQLPEFDPRLGQRWTLVEEDNDEGISYSFPVCAERQQFGAKPCSDVPSSGKLQYSLCLQPTTEWFRFTYFVSSTEDLGESGVTVSLNGERVLNASTFVSVRYALGDRGLDTARSWTDRPVIFDDSDTRGGKSCSCDQGSLLGYSCIIDCSGRCASVTWLGDGVCHDEFNCEWLNHDEGDCYEHWVIKEGRQFDGLPGDWLSFSKDGHDQLIMVAGAGGHGVFGFDGNRRLGSDTTLDGPTLMPTCEQDHQVVLGNASAWTVCETTSGGLAFFHSLTGQWTLRLFITQQGRVWAAGSAGSSGAYVPGQTAIGLYPESESFAPCATGLQPLLTIGDWTLCESREKLCWYRSEVGAGQVGTQKRSVLKFYLTSGSQVWSSYDRGHFLSTTRRLVPESFEPAGGSVTNGVWRAHTAVNGSGSEYILWINGEQLQKSSGDSITQFTSDCFNSGIVIAILAKACGVNACALHGALRFSTMWCGEAITTNADDWRCTAQSQDESSRWQHNDFVEDSTWQSPRTINAQGLAFNSSSPTGWSEELGRFTGDRTSKWIWAPTSRGHHPVTIWCRYARQGVLSAEVDPADQQGSTDPGTAGDNQVTTDGPPGGHSQVSGYVILGALLAASVAALTRKFFNQSWQQKLDGELHLGMVVGYEESQFDYSTENPVNRREDVDVAVRQSILNRFGDDHEAIGSIIDTGGLDNLSIDSVIGRGARSVVYAAEYMGCRVALKQLQLVDPSVRNTHDAEGAKADGSAAGGPGADTRSADEDSAIQQVLKEFAAEVRILSKLQHPNVIKYVGFTTNPHCLIIQEFAPNGDLRSYLEAQKQHHQALIAAGRADPSSGPLTLNLQVTMALDIARGMEYLHGRTPSVLHRDLKSPNLLVDENLRIKITDFGLAREKDTTREGKTGLMTVCGTPLWTAPEILKGQLYNEAADVYSFSLCFWELWSMCVPFHELGLGPMEVLLQVVNDDRRPTMPDEIPPLFADLVVRCWATDARERPTFVAIVAELETFAELSGFGAILAPKAFEPPESVSAELASIDSVNSLASTSATSGTGSDLTLAASSSVFSLESASASAHTEAQGGVTAL